MNLPYLNVSGFNRLPVIRQSTSSECLLACLNMVCHYYGNRVDMVELRRKHNLSIRGANLKTLVDLSLALDLSTRTVKCEIEEMSSLRTPCVLHWGFNHFVVLKKVKKKSIEIHDPAVGYREVTLSEVNREFTGIAVEFMATPEFKKSRAASTLKLSDLVKFDVQFFNRFALGLLLCIFAEFLVLISPLYMQVVIDDVLMKGDELLLESLAIGFGFVVLFSMISNVLRKLTFQFIGHILSFDMASRVFQRLVSLPMSYFANRQTGDVQHRVQSLKQISYFLTNGAPTLILDSVFSLLIIALMFFYHATLTFGVVIGVIVYCLWRWVVFGLMRRVAGDLIISEAAVETQLLETLRTIQTIKLSSLETQRESSWRNLLANKINAGLRVGNLDITNQAVNEVIFEGMRVVIIFVAAKMVLNNEMSIGMLTAFVAYYGRFSQRIASLIEEVVKYTLLSVPLMRVADIVFTKPEELGHSHIDGEQISGLVDLRGVAFSYGSTDELVLKRISMRVSPGEFVAIIGPSGAGKSTLLKIIAGIEKPLAGHVLFDSQRSAHLNQRSLRNQIGVVLQDDSLFKGTIAENVALFNDSIDIDRVKKLCQECAIADEIEAMPMKYETLIGDLGSSLSGGQKQRLLLARALYKRPKILLLDEATSHLDYDNEKRIASTLKALGITRIVIAHRQETIEAADRTFVLANGVLVNKVHEAIANQASKKSIQHMDIHNQ